jgi:hypothetical protein
MAARLGYEGIEEPLTMTRCDVRRLDCGSPENHAWKQVPQVETLDNVPPRASPQLRDSFKPSVAYKMADT